MSQTESTTMGLPPASEGASDGSINLIGLLVAMLSEWRIGLITFVVISAVCVSYVFSIKPQYVATATFLPQEGHSQADAFASIFSMRGPGAIYIGLLGSRSVQNQVIDDLGLLQVFHTSSYESARDQLAGKAAFSEGGAGIVTISVRDGSAQEAAKIANAYMTALQELDDKMGSAQTRQTRTFFVNQLQQEKADLEKAEHVLQATQERTGLIQPEAQTGSSLGAIAGIRQRITDLEVQLAGLQQSATDENPQVQRLKSQMVRLRAQEAEYEHGGTTPMGAPPAASQIPITSLDYEHAQRDVAFHNQLVSSLSSQYEASHLAEVFARTAFQVIDPAVAPEHKAWPPRKPYAMASLVFGAIMGLVIIILKLIARRVLSDPEHRQHLRALRSAFRAS